jgi:hypothetical protein
MGIRRVAWITLLGACVINVPGASRPAVTAGGTWSCQQIVEQCDASCQDPSCLDGCTAHGTPDAQQQHNAVVSCGQRNFCTSEACMTANCSSEMQGCTAEVQPPQPPPAPAPG